MRLSPLITIVAALVGLMIVAAIGFIGLQPPRPLLANGSITPEKITPNADGSDDIASINYVLNRNAAVTISFTNRETKERFIFRNAERRIPDAYTVLFSGIVDASAAQQTSGIESHLMPDGMYDWLIEAVTDSGETQQQSGVLTVENSDSALPLIRDFTISPQIFTPNQDGIDDRLNINIYLEKEATLTVYLEDAEKRRYYVAERREGRKLGEAGAHFFDYDGGVDNNTRPPANGTYTVVAIAEDKVGQRVRRTASITLDNGGLPNAEIAPQPTGSTVSWTTATYNDVYFTDETTSGEKIILPEGVTSTLAKITLPQHDLLIFRLTVSNYGETPLRTIGPWPGTVYQYEQKHAAMNADALSGAWRVGVECERTDSSYPWRWAIGTSDKLTKVEREGETLYYLMPGQQAVVWGAVRMSRLIPTRNPQECWAALIHEDVAIPPMQNRVGPIKVELTPKTLATSR